MAKRVALMDQLPRNAIAGPKEAVLDALTEKASNNIQRVWPETGALSEAQVHTLSFSLHWLFHVAGECKGILEAFGGMVEDGHRMTLTLEQSVELSSLSHGLLSDVSVLFSKETETGSSALIEWADYLPEWLRATMGYGADLQNTRFDTWDAGVRRERGGEDTADLAARGLRTMVDISACYIKALEWLVETRRPSRCQLRRCLKYLYAWTMELCSLAILSELWVH